MRLQIYIRSSDYNRTIQSAKANLAGFYGSSDVASAIHIHVISRSEDYLLNVERACPEAKRLLAEELQSEFVRTKEAENKEFMRFLSNATGLRVRSFTQLSRVFDPLNCEVSCLNSECEILKDPALEVPQPNMAKLGHTGCFRTNQGPTLSRVHYWCG